MNDAAPNGAQSGMVGGGYRDAVPTVLGQQAREWGQGGTCPSQGGKDYGRFKGALRAGLDQGHATIEIGCQHPVGVQRDHGVHHAGAQLVLPADRARPRVQRE